MRLPLVRYGTVSAPTNPHGLRQSIYESMGTLRHTAIRSEGPSISDRAPGSTVSFYANTEEAKKDSLPMRAKEECGSHNTPAKIPPGDFRWYAAFHDEGERPHIHMMAWSAKPGQAYLSKEGIRQIKSKLTNDIFRNEMLHLYEQKSESRDELVRQARRAMLELVQTMRDSMCDHPDAERLMLELAAQLETVKGKKSYGYLPKRLKKLVDEIVNEMERLPGVSRCYDQWLLLQGKVAAYYHDKLQERIPLSQQKEFRQIKNAVIQEAERLRLGEITFEEKGLNQQDEPEEYRNASYDYWTLRDVIRDESLTIPWQEIEDHRHRRNSGAYCCAKSTGSTSRTSGMQDCWAKTWSVKNREYFEK